MREIVWNNPIDRATYSDLINKEKELSEKYTVVGLADAILGDYIKFNKGFERNLTATEVATTQRVPKLYTSIGGPRGPLTKLLNLRLTRTANGSDAEAKIKMVNLQITDEISKGDMVPRQVFDEPFLNQLI